ncbi:MAG: hypothetical protein IJO91_06630 [Oscillospiraceae bacterium]|nr:hypothetical protein [Oscillospiraceae bacterium]
MTVSKLHEYMTEKVIPESVMPQNIPAVLMDENSQIPELDAFTFLNRVRALGIGSADFLYLLKGCNAPEEAVRQIEENPAMNLQTLVVTLESSGLTAQDYTRMLYTARQIWERTLTMQLEDYEQDEKPSVDEIIGYAPSEDADEEYQDTSESQDNTAIPDETDAENSENECDNDTSSSAEYDEDELSDNDEYEADTLDDDDDDNDREPLDFGIHDREEKAKSNVGKIVASAVGACVLLGLSATMNFIGFKPVEEVKAPPIIYAEDAQSIFNQIYTAYNNGTIGGEKIIPRSFDTAEVFGDMLIQRPEGLGTYSVGELAYSVFSDSITVYQRNEGTVSVVGTIPAPENGRFIHASCNGELVTLVFTDESGAGLISYGSTGESVYSCRQQGVLTDISISDENISLGTIYVPEFTESFTAEDTEKYLPVIQLDNKGIVLSPSDVVITPEAADGCGYALYCEYNTTDGTVIDKCAVLGDPVFSGAEDLSAVMNTTDGYKLIKRSTDEQPLISTDLGNITAADDGDVFISAEKAEDGSVTVYLRGEDGQPLSAVANLPEGFTSLKEKDDILYLCGENGVLMAADISDPTAPAIKELTSAFGIVQEEYALCSESSVSVVKLTLYKRENDTAKTVSSYSRPISAQLSEAPEMAGANSFFIYGEEQCGAAYSYFDGVSVISEYGIFGKVKTSYTLFDDRTGFTAAARFGEELHLIFGEKSFVIE